MYTLINIYVVFFSDKFGLGNVNFNLDNPKLSFSPDVRFTLHVDLQVYNLQTRYFAGGKAAFQLHFFLVTNPDLKGTLFNQTVLFNRNKWERKTITIAL